MNERLSALEQDIGFLKALAVEGRSTTLVGGSILVAAGATFGLASLGQWAAASGLTPTFSGWIFPAIWAAAMAAFMVELAVISRRLSPHKSAGAADRSVGAAWSALGWTIFALVACTAIVSWRMHSEAPAMMLPSIVLALYGLCWSVAASSMRKGWVWAAAYGAYAAAVIVAVLSGTTTLYLVFAGALVLLLIIPGLALVR
jgi:hypothetical protein